MALSVLEWLMFFVMVLWAGFLLQHYIRIKYHRKNS